MFIWDTGTYETEKFNDNAPDGPAKGGEVIVTLHGDKIDGRYALIQTDGKNWLAHRMKEQKRPTAGDLAPMLSTEGSVAKLKKTQWAFEGKWDGYRVWSRPTTAASACGPVAGAMSPGSTRSSRRWPPISPITT